MCNCTSSDHPFIGGGSFSCRPPDLYYTDQQNASYCAKGGDSVCYKPDKCYKYGDYNSCDKNICDRTDEYISCNGKSTYWSFTEQPPITLAYHDHFGGKRLCIPPGMGMTQHELDRQGMKQDIASISIPPNSEVKFNYWDNASIDTTLGANIYNDLSDDHENDHNVPTKDSILHFVSRQKKPFNCHLKRCCAMTADEKVKDPDCKGYTDSGCNDFMQRECKKEGCIKSDECMIWGKRNPVYFDPIVSDYCEAHLDDAFCGCYKAQHKMRQYADDLKIPIAPPALCSPDCARDAAWKPNNIEKSCSSNFNTCINLIESKGSTAVNYDQVTQTCSINTKRIDSNTTPVDNNTNKSDSIVTHDNVTTDNTVVIKQRLFYVLCVVVFLIAAYMGYLYTQM